MAVLFLSPSENAEQWRDMLLRFDPNIDFRCWPETGRVEEIEFALVWRPPACIRATRSEMLRSLVLVTVPEMVSVASSVVASRGFMPVMSSRSQSRLPCCVVCCCVADAGRAAPPSNA